MLPPTKALLENLQGHTMVYRGLVEYIDVLTWTEPGCSVPREIHWFDVDGVIVKIDLNDRAIYIDDADAIFPLDRDKEVIPTKYICATLHCALQKVFVGATVDGRIADVA